MSRLFTSNASRRDLFVRDPRKHGRGFYIERIQLICLLPNFPRTSPNFGNILETLMLNKSENSEHNKLNQIKRINLMQ